MELTADLKLAAALFPEQQKFIDATFAKREKEITELHEVKPDGVKDSFEPYRADVEALKKRLGYNTEEAKQEVAKKAGDQEEQAAKERVDFEEEVKAAVAKKPWAGLDHAAVKHCDDVLKKYHQDFMLVANSLLERTADDKLVSLAGIPFAKEAADPKEFLLAIILQNALHAANS